MLQFVSAIIVMLSLTCGGWFYHEGQTSVKKQSGRTAGTVQYRCMDGIWPQPPPPPPPPPPPK